MDEHAANVAAIHAGTAETFSWLFVPFLQQAGGMEQIYDADAYTRLVWLPVRLLATISAMVDRASIPPGARDRMPPEFSAGAVPRYVGDELQEYTAYRVLHRSYNEPSGSVMLLLATAARVQHLCREAVRQGPDAVDELARHMEMRLRRAAAFHAADVAGRDTLFPVQRPYTWQPREQVDCEVWLWNAHTPLRFIFTQQAAADHWAPLRLQLQPGDDVRLRAWEHLRPSRMRNQAPPLRDLGNAVMLCGYMAGTLVVVLVTGLVPALAAEPLYFRMMDDELPPRYQRFFGTSFYNRLPEPPVQTPQQRARPRDVIPTTPHQQRQEAYRQRRRNPRGILQLQRLS